MAAIFRIAKFCRGSKVDMRKLTWGFTTCRPRQPAPPPPMLSLQSFLRKGASLGYVGLNQNLKDLKDLLAPLHPLFLSVPPYLPIYLPICLSIYLHLSIYICLYLSISIYPSISIHEVLVRGHAGLIINEPSLSGHSGGAGWNETRWCVLLGGITSSAQPRRRRTGGAANLCAWFLSNNVGKRGKKSSWMCGHCTLHSRDRAGCGVPGCTSNASIAGVGVRGVDLR